jgi:hypothetical protein
MGIIDYCGRRTYAGQAMEEEERMKELLFRGVALRVDSDAV